MILDVDENDRHRHRRDRRHRGRHREPAFPRGHPPAPERPGQGEHALHPPHPRAFHQDRRGDEDEAHPAQRQGAAGDRHPAGHPAVQDGGSSCLRRSRTRSPSSATSRRTRSSPRRTWIPSTPCPLMYNREGLDDKIRSMLNIWAKKPDLIRMAEHRGCHHGPRKSRWRSPWSGST